MTLSDLQWLSEIVSDTNHRAVTLRQLSFLFSKSCCSWFTVASCCEIVAVSAVISVVRRRPWLYISRSAVITGLSLQRPRWWWWWYCVCRSVTRSTLTTCRLMITDKTSGQKHAIITNDIECIFIARQHTDTAILSVRPSVRHVPVFCRNGLT